MTVIMRCMMDVLSVNFNVRKDATNVLVVSVLVVFLVGQ